MRQLPFDPGLAPCELQPCRYHRRLRRLPQRHERRGQTRGPLDDDSRVQRLPHDDSVVADLVP
jgi:hypothetical protein